MKTIKLLFTVTAFAIAAIASAVEKPKMNVIPLTADRAIVAITNENAAYFELSIEAEDGSMVYYKESNKPLTDYQKVFDFANLEDGSYVLNLKVNDTQLSRDIEVAHKGIYVGDSKLTFDPYFDYKDNVLKFSYLNFDKENLNLSIYSKGDLVYKSKIGNNFAVSSGYDLSKLDSGEYTVILSSLNDEYAFSLVK
ncbi:hypothetical protein GM418_12995 [Maribellus comscasis]|uniref:Por secretion system C-terminal sorting domain-containing protein n=1 Tax=Maribellus comscasis TaxID=2681766 RepID=A0A6I6K3N0_9BACT|nr:hypothetical protein [Maribellus comscasis]QGY44544.1 hypothetical protein GM418_12995 [Maribellus comscasis]